MCPASASSASEPDSRPPTTSTTMNVAVSTSATCTRRRLSASEWLSLMLLILGRLSTRVQTLPATRLRSGNRRALLATETVQQDGGTLRGQRQRIDLEALVRRVRALPGGPEARERIGVRGHERDVRRAALRRIEQRHRAAAERLVDPGQGRREAPVSLGRRHRRIAVLEH